MYATVPFETNWRKLCALKDRGINAEDVQATLESMIEEAEDEGARDRIADLLDCVVGWCGPEFAVWKK